MSRKRSFCANRIAKRNRNFGEEEAKRKTGNWWKHLAERKKEDRK
jgi:deoxyadenosine/deoxycytidine kinase